MGIFPLSKLPSSAVTVWATASLLYQVTVLPADTDRLAGLNAIFFMDTVLVGGGVFVLPELYPLLLLQ
jgi:hypothetical protein